MKNSNLFIKLFCIPALLISYIVNLKAQNELIGYTYLGIFDNHHYYLSNCGTTWGQANEAAIEMGGYLATITGYECLENVFLADYANVYTEGDGAWIGLRGEQGIYEWANGDPIGSYMWLSDFVEEPVYADGAALIGVDGYSCCYGGDLAEYSCSFDNYFRWKSYPISGEFKYIVEFSFQPNCNENPNKTYICHNGNTICVNNSAVQAHLNHGDLEGPCGPCNGYAMQTLPDDESVIEGQVLLAKTVVMSEYNWEGDSIQEMQPFDEIHIFPNPASEQIQVVLPGVFQKGTLRILFLTGQEIHTLLLSGQQSITLDLSAYAAGFYLIDVQCADGHYQKRIVKL